MTNRESFVSRAALWIGAAILLGACSAPEPPLPTAEPRGLIAADAEPPAGAETWTRPEWRVGDHFVLVRGERLRGEFRVVGVDDPGEVVGGYAIDVGGGRMLRRDLDFGNLGEWSEAGEPLRLLSPVDVRYHWPLWVGKRWSCEFVDRPVGGPALMMAADYLVEGVDTVIVPAGEFRALRIVRRLRLTGVDGDWMTRTQITWYAPDPGIEVRHLNDDSLIELIEWQRG
jgi:hypothetical protein